MSTCRHILVTGSSGTVGTAFTQRLMAEGHRVTPLDLRPSIWDKHVNRRTRRCDLRRLPDLLKLRTRPDMIVHLAANARVHELVVKPHLALDNYIMVHNVLEYARLKGVKRVLFSSSREVYGESRTDVKRSENDTHVTGIKAPYTASKFAAEALIHAYHQCYGIRPVIARLSNVYGRYDVSERFLPVCMYYARRNMPISIFGKAKRLDFTYIDDCADGLTRIVERFDKVAGMTFNLSRGKGERLIDLARLVVDCLDSKSRITISDKRVGEITTFVGDLSLARRHLDYRPKMRLKDAVEPSVEWYLEAMKDRRIYATQRRILKKLGWI